MVAICESKAPSAEFWPDKVIKYAAIPIILIMAIVALIVLFGVDRVKCTSRDRLYYRSSSQVNDYCWSNLRPAVQKIMINTTPIYNHTLFSTPPPNATTETYEVWIENAPLFRHKLFPILLLCECACLAIALLVWHWCLAGEMRSLTRDMIEHKNNLTRAYQAYDRSKLTKDEVAVHRELENYLEYLAYALSSKSRRLYILQLVKWIVMFVITVAWFGGNLGLFSPDFVIFTDNFICLFDKEHGIWPYDCHFPTAVYLRVAWYINIVILGILIILMLIYIILLLCIRRKYSDTFLHNSVPGAMDPRLAGCVQRNYDPRYVALLSKLCEENDGLSVDPGLAKTLARKYGRPGDDSSGVPSGDGEKPGFVKRDQIDKFEQSADGGDNSSSLCCGSCCGSTSDKNKDMGHDKEIPDNRVSQTVQPPETDHDRDLEDYYRRSNGFPNGEVNPRNGGPDDLSPRSIDNIPDYLYFRELFRYKHPDGIKPEYPVDYSKPAHPKEQQSVITSQNKSPKSQRKVAFRLPRRFRKRPSKQRRVTVSPSQPDVIVLEDVEEYPKKSDIQAKPSTYAPAQRQSRHAPQAIPVTDNALNSNTPAEVMLIEDLDQYPKGPYYKQPPPGFISILDPSHSPRFRRRNDYPQANGYVPQEDLPNAVGNEKHWRSTTTPNLANPSHQRVGHENPYPEDKQPRLYGGEHGQQYHNPYSGALSSRVLMPYYDQDSGQYKDLNPLAYKIRQTVRQEMSRNMKVWKP